MLARVEQDLPRSVVGDDDARIELEAVRGQGGAQRLFHGDRGGAAFGEEPQGALAAQDPETEARQLAHEEDVEAEQVLAEQTEEELQKRSSTLVSVIGTTIQVVILFIFLLMVLSELTINIAAFLTGAGVLGLAVGFGAQSLVKDVLAGVFIILENQYRKGDVVAIAGISGLVEEINLRRTILRDLDGITHIVPNGEIKVASNFTKQWSRANFNISVAYDTDLDKAMAVINRVGKEMAEDPEWAPLIISPPRALRVDNLGPSGIEIKVLGETKPIKQWDVMGELRLRLKKEFDKEGIEIPWPHMKVYFGNTPSQMSAPKKGSSSEKKDAKATHS